MYAVELSEQSTGQEMGQIRQDGQENQPIQLLFVMLLFDHTMAQLFKSNQIKFYL